MFTGIVQGVARVVAVRELDDFRVHVLEMPPRCAKGLRSERLLLITAFA